MRVRVLLFGVLKDIFRRSEEWLELSSNATVSDLLRHYRELAPEKAKFFQSLALAVNQQYASPEEILEAYYNYEVRKGINVTANFQEVNHPGYNRDRGPVAISTLRVHVEF